MWLLLGQSSLFPSLVRPRRCPASCIKFLSGLHSFHCDARVSQSSKLISGSSPVKQSTGGALPRLRTRLGSVPGSETIKRVYMPMERHLGQKRSRLLVNAFAEHNALQERRLWNAVQLYACVPWQLNASRGS